MAASLVNKIVLKNTTKMSLNERFTAYRAEAQTVANSYRQKIQMQRQASSANLRLAQQMANRPTVIAALRLKKRSLQQRLGLKQPYSNIKSRLNLSAKRIFAGTPLRGRLGGRGGRGAFRPGTSPLIKARLGVARQGFNANGNQRGRARNRRGSFRGGNRNNGVRNQINRNSNQRNPRGRGRGRGRGSFGGRWNRNTSAGLPTKQELDNQLDEYMAETKSSLDAQLGVYMSQG
ncbi:chromatin target of PRMT1 protein [Parasteatoda tepidariorum]|uniref:chromatin target of PRMT1 protein n=1 Tax=Parasteatoda tepidariorum TaxID=114398 RepID=UPI00077FBCDD|nr:chromatin target of PRMT1 protein [Parasteatoda tepidariorum]